MPRAGRLKGMGFFWAAVRVRAVACAGACQGSGAAVLGLARIAATRQRQAGGSGGLGPLGGRGSNGRQAGRGALRRAGRGGGALVFRRFVGFSRRFVGCHGFKCPAVPVRPAVLNAPRPACQPFFCCPDDPPRAPSPPTRLPAVLMPRFLAAMPASPARVRPPPPSRPLRAPSRRARRPKKAHALQPAPQAPQPLPPAPFVRGGARSALLSASLRPMAPAGGFSGCRFGFAGWRCVVSAEWCLQRAARCVVGWRCVVSAEWCLQLLYVVCRVVSAEWCLQLLYIVCRVVSAAVSVACV